MVYTLFVFMKYSFHLVKILLIMKRILTTLMLSIGMATNAQMIPLPENLPHGYPRLMTTDAGRQHVRSMVENELWAKDVLNGILERIDPYMEKTQLEPDWLYSRLMMYWKSKATQVYIKGGLYSHADGEAPVPTVRFGSTRGVYSPFSRPKLEDIVPYMDDTKGVYFHNTTKEGRPLEWVEQSNVSGNSIEGVNEEILKLAKDAAFIYWFTGDDKYGKFAFDVFDTYLMGMYYRKEPIDLNNGHAQTLVGLSTFEVIQERVLNELAYTYDFLYLYIEKNKPLNIEKYAATFKKWIDITIKNGVPQNNWNLHQAKFILKVAMVLDDNHRYADGKGREYYIDYILNKTSARQWSLTKFMNYGYDPRTGIWNECPSYAMGVTRDLTNFVRDYENTFNQNLLPYTPVLTKAVEVLPQYLFPNNLTSAFGDSYYGELSTEAISDMIRMAQKYNNKEQETYFTSMYKLFNAQRDLPETNDHSPRLPAQISSFFTTKPLALNKDIKEGKITDYVTQTFYAPNVSWFVQRTNYADPLNGLMISQYASYGNHAHSNGVAMELYGKGVILGAESGIGSTYFEKPYLEYYSQFPAHNTVMVDGISKYPEMLSNHPFDLLGCYPQPEQKTGYYPNITYSEVYFLEPESRSDQNRLLSIVRTGKTTGYYVDIFRSKKQRGGEKFHDYYYHNLGQELLISDTRGNALNLQPSDNMGFAGGHLFALDYMWDKQSAQTNGVDYQAVWKMSMPDNNHIYMSLWMKGYPEREVFSIKAPPCRAYRKGNKYVPYNNYDEPFLTIAARQHGEAWNHPFVSVYEPSSEKDVKSIETIKAFEAANNISQDFVGIMVKSKSGRVDYIFSSVKEEIVKYEKMEVCGSYAIISEDKDDFILFLGKGTYLKGKGFTIEAAKNTNATLEYRNGEYYLSCESPIVIHTPQGKQINMSETNYKKIKL